MAVLLGRPLLGLLTILPVGGVVILLYAFMVIAGYEFGPVTATLAAVVIGVGVDYTIHVTHRFQEFLREGESIDVAVTRTLQTMLVIYARRSERSEQEPEGQSIPVFGGIQSQARPK